MRINPVVLVCTVVLLPLLLSSPSTARMSINDMLWEIEQKNGSTTAQVYEISDDEGRADAIHYIEKECDPGQELIDAAQAGDSTLKERLKGGFMLFATLSEKSKLFREAAEPLNIRIEGNTLRWGDLTVPITDDLRIMLVGKNPYGDGYCIVFAAGSSRMLVGINGIWASRNQSYAICQGDKVVKQGSYSRHFVLARDPISQAEAVADVNQLFSTLQRVHPDLLAKVSLDDHINLKQQTLEEITKKLGKDGTIAMTDFTYLLYYAVAFFQDGHTSIHWGPTAPPETASDIPVKRLPPFLLAYDNGRFVVRASSDKRIEGLEVLSVDGKPIQEFLRPTLDRISGETLAWKASLLTSNLFWYYFFDLCGSAESLTLRLRDAQGKQSEQKVATLSFDDFTSRDWSRQPNKLQERRMQGSQMHFLDSDRVAHFVYPAFNYSEDEERKIDSIFQQIKTKGYRDLIIDIRGNEGGHSEMGNFIFKYLYPGRFCQYSKIRVKLSRDIRCDAVMDTLEDIPQDADLDGLIATHQFEERSMPKPDAFYSGRVFLLVDNGTFSAASGFATMFRDYGVGTILGYETGGLPVNFGNWYEFELENSGIQCGVSFKQFFNAKPRPGDDEHGVLPDIPMSREVLQPYQKEDDPVLAYTIDYIKKTRRR